MATKKPQRSRVAQTGLKKKVHVPIWAILGSIVIIAGIGIAFIYNSYARPTPVRTVYCNSGYRSCSLYRTGEHVNARYAEIGRYAGCNGHASNQTYRLLSTGKLPGSAWRCLY